MQKEKIKKLLLFVFVVVVFAIGGIVIEISEQRQREGFFGNAPIGAVYTYDPAPEVMIDPEDEEYSKLWININTDKIYELTLLDGIGDELAIRIINYRKTNGDFGVIEEVMKVSGIGEKTFEKFKDNIYVEKDDE